MVWKEEIPLSYVCINERGRIITNYFRKLSSYFFIDEVWKRYFLFVFKCGFVFWCVCSLVFLYIIYMLLLGCFFFLFCFLMGILSPSESVIRHLAASKLSPTSLLTVIPELVILIVTRDYQLLYRFGSFRVLFQIRYSHKLDSDLLLLSLMFFWLYCSLW